jgi:cell division protein FtsN
MRQQGRTRSRNTDDEPIIQLTRGQMVLAVCGLLIGALIFYLLGVVTSRLEPMFSKSQTQQQTSHVLPAPDVPGPSKPPQVDQRRKRPAPEGVQASPRTDVVAGNHEHDQARHAREVRTDDGAPLTRVPAPVGLSDTPASREVLEAEVKAPVPEKQATPANKPKRVELSPSKETEKPADISSEKLEDKSKTTETGKKREEISPKPAVKSEESVQTEPAPSKQPEAEKKTELTIDAIEPSPDEAVPSSSSPKEAGQSFYSIQLIAFSKANRSKAEAYANQIRESTGLDVELEDASDGKYVRVFVGRYKDRQSALKACRELQKQERFSKVFVPQDPRGGESKP